MSGPQPRSTLIDRVGHLLTPGATEGDRSGVGKTETPPYSDLSDWLALRLLSDIREGKLKPGEHLREAEIAESFKLSRTPVRDALGKLTELGVVERRQPRGIFVRPWTDRDRMEALQLMDALILLSVDLGIDLLKESDLAALDRIVGEVETRAREGTLTPSRQMEIDGDFHLIIARATGNDRLVDLMQKILLPLRLYEQESTDFFEPSFWLSLHAGLLEAMRRGDRGEAIDRAIRNMRESRQVLYEESAAGEPI